MAFFNLFPTQTYQRLLKRARGDTRSWACHACNSTHPVSYADLPGCSNYLCGKEKDLHGVWCTVTGGREYGFQPRHHQIVLKYARRHRSLSCRQQIYFHQLMSPYTGELCVGHDPDNGITSPSNPRKLDVIVRPRLLLQPPVHPGATPIPRLIIKFTWMYVAPEGCTPASPKDLNGFQLCPHSTCMLDEANLYSGKPDTLDRVFTQQVQRAFDQSSLRQRACWCPVCLVDYSIEASANSNVVVVRAWYDLLSEGASGDPHLVDIPQLDYSRLYHKKRACGSIQKLYESGSEVELPPSVQKSSSWEKLKGAFTGQAKYLNDIGHMMKSGLHGHQPAAA